jgi:membrane-bound serine protease (ClpP class)
MLRRRSTATRARRTRTAVYRAATLLCAGFLLTFPLLAAAPGTPGGAVVIPIRGEISDVMKGSIERRLAEARENGVTTVIFEMDTPGGLVTSALDICRLIKNVPPDTRTVAWVNPRAYSAGAMISVACDTILMSSSSAIGDCAPIMVSPGGGLQELPAAERAKAESPVLQEFRDSAARNGYPPLLLRAMVTVGEEVWWVENVQTGERRFVTGDEKAELLGEDRGEFSFGEDESAAAPQWQLVESYTDPQSGNTVPAKQPVDSEAELLTVSQSEAVVYGIASGITPDLTAVADQLGLAAAPRYFDTTGWEEFVMWLNSPLVRGILFVIVLIGAYIEFQSPGLILPGITAGVALLIFLGAPYAAGLADIWTFVLLGIGLLLLGVELFLLPGFGIAGLLGLLAIGISLIGSFVPEEPVRPGDFPLFNWPSLPGTWDAIQYGITVMSSSIIVATMGIILLIRYLPQLAVGRLLIPANPEAEALAVGERAPEVFVGDIGVVTGPLRPSGPARFGQEIVDVTSQGEYVDVGKRVQVIKREGMNIFVRPIPSESEA